MALTPYIWALWQTKAGKVIIIALLIYLVVSTLVSMFKWWTIPIVVAVVGAFYLQLKIDDRQLQKEMEKFEKEKRN